MPNFRRYYLPNSLIFITSVTKDRQPYLKSEDDIQIFMDTLREVKNLYPFRLLAYVILPDHFHWIMKVDNREGNFSDPMHSIKRNFTLNYKVHHNIEGSLSIWQPRFWDHIIRDENDLGKHFDYIHWNPVNHGYVKAPEYWLHSSFVFWMNKGYYGSGWGMGNKPNSIVDMDFE